jgi:sulfite reductase beta subunit-like hemoprotein
VIRDFLPEEDLLSYTTAIMRVYNLHGRRDNKYKARIKILVKSLGAEEFARQVEPGRPLQLRPTARHARTEHRAGRRRARATCSDLGRKRRRRAWRRRTSAC